MISSQQPTELISMEVSRRLNKSYMCVSQKHIAARRREVRPKREAFVRNVHGITIMETRYAVGLNDGKSGHYGNDIMLVVVYFGRDTDNEDFRRLESSYE